MPGFGGTPPHVNEHHPSLVTFTVGDKHNRTPLSCFLFSYLLKGRAMAHTRRSGDTFRNQSPPTWWFGGGERGQATRLACMHTHPESLFGPWVFWDRVYCSSGWLLTCSVAEQHWLLPYAQPWELRFRCVHRSSSPWQHSQSYTILFESHFNFINVCNFQIKSRITPFSRNAKKPSNHFLMSF